MSEGWNQFKITFHKELERIKIPRLMYDSTKDDKFIEFCDVAYSAVIYARTKMSGSHHITIVESKTKVTPIHQVSLPRLELCGANLLTRLCRQVSKAVNIALSKFTLFTDSEIVLAWLSLHPCR